MDRRKWTRNITIMVLGAFNAESFSSATPPYKWVYDPWSIFVTFMFYGLSLLVIEDLVSRYSLDYRKLLIIGVIYGILEEGFLALTNELPGWQGMGVGFGRYFGLSVPWTIFIAEFHAVYTVVLTFMIADLIIPREKTGPVLSKWQYVPVLGYLAILYLFVPNFVTEMVSTSSYFAMLLFQSQFFLSNFFLINSVRWYPSWESIFIQLGVILMLAILVIRLARLDLNSSEKKIISWKSYMILVLGFELMFWIPYIFQFFGGPDVLAIVYYLALPIVFWRLILSKIRRDSTFDREKIVAIALTLLLFFGGFGGFIYIVMGDLLGFVIIVVALWIEVELITRKHFLLKLFKR
ncbi:MAG: hypothetical protein ACUVXA_17305 [Candidatus Jordarchaeum sp.]|uniref:hypothetical protein n=1 Tax=Candidatus Jordarchaeum sp. TaxID=2823881 RepID=UPI00404B2BFA